MRDLEFSGETFKLKPTVIAIPEGGGTVNKCFNRVGFSPLTGFRPWLPILGTEYIVATCTNSNIFYFLFSLSKKKNRSSLGSWYGHTCAAWRVTYKHCSCFWVKKRNTESVLLMGVLSIAHRKGTGRDLSGFCLLRWRWWQMLVGSCPLTPPPLETKNNSVNIERASESRLFIQEGRWSKLRYP